MLLDTHIFLWFILKDRRLSAGSIPVMQRLGEEGEKRH